MTRQQRWSLAAHQKIMAVKAQPNEASYNTLARKTPALIQRAGLIQALVFLESRSDGVGAQFCNDLAAVYEAGWNRERLRAQAQQGELAAYLALSRDIIDVAIWFRRFAQVELSNEEN